MMPFCSGVYGRDELLLQARVPTGLPKAPALEDQPIVTAEDRGTDGPECPEALETGRFDRSLRLLRPTPEGKLVADEFPVMAINHGGQMRPAIVLTSDMRHIHRPPFVAPAHLTHPAAHAGPRVDDR
jgi:hypothetical protein